MPIKQIARRITGNDYVFTVLTKVFALLIGLVASAFSNRYLGPELKGQLAGINATLTIVAITANFGLYQPLPYYKRLGTPDVLDKFLRIFLLQFIAYTVVGVVLARALNSFAITAVCLIAPVQVLANQMSFTITVEDVKFKNVIFFTARITNTLITILAFYTLQPSLLVALALIVVGDVITVVMAFYRIRRLPNPFRADLRFLLKILPFGLVTMLTTLMLTLNYKVDVLMMEVFGVLDAQIGYYTLGVSLAEYGWLISDAFREVLFSRTAKDDAVGEITMSLKINLYLTLVVIAGIVVFGRPAIYVIGGSEFLPAYGVTVILLLGVLSMSYFKIIGTLLLAKGKKGTYLGMLTGSVLVNVAVNAVAIPAMGKEGAAIASVLSYTVAGGLFLLYFLRTYGVPAADVFVLRRADVRRILAKFKR